MRIAKFTASLGLALLIGGASGFFAETTLAIGSVLLLSAATIGAIALEDRDLDVSAALTYGTHDAEAAVIDLVRPTAVGRPSMRRAA